MRTKKHLALCFSILLINQFFVQLSGHVVFIFHGDCTTIFYVIYYNLHTTTKYLKTDVLLDFLSPNNRKYPTLTRKNLKYLVFPICKMTPQHKKHRIYSRKGCKGDLVKFSLLSEDQSCENVTGHSVRLNSFQSRNCKRTVEYLPAADVRKSCQAYTHCWTCTLEP